MDNYVNVLGKEIKTKDKTITEVIKESIVGVEMNELEANKLYRFISCEFKSKDSGKH